MRARTFVLLLIFANLGLTAQTRPTAPAQPPSLREARLPPKVRSDIVSAIVEDAQGLAEGPRLQEIALNSSVSFLKLGRNGATAIVVETYPNPLCGNHGNCPFYLFMNVNGRAVSIFHAVGNGPEVDPAIHHGMHDISWADVLSAGMNAAVEIDHFDGKAYHSAYCYEQTADEDGKVKETPHHKC